MSVRNEKVAAQVGLVGAGGIAQAYVQALQSNGVGKLVGIADVRTEAARRLAEIADCPSFSSVDDMMSCVSRLDVVIVCTPPATHVDICLALAERGVHILCEKPLALDSREARRMLGAASAAGVKLSMASKFRHVDDVIRAKALVNSGILGEILLFENVFTSHVDMGSRWNSDPLVSGGGVLIDNGTHSVDIMRFFLGPLVDLHVVEGKRIQELPVEDTVHMFVRSADGVVGSIDLSWSMNKEQPNYISIYGSKGTVLVGWKESKYRQAKDGEWIVFGKGYNKVEAFRRQIENFLACIRGEQTLVVTPEDALASVETIEAAYRALQRDSWDLIGEHHADCEESLECNIAEQA